MKSTVVLHVPDGGFGGDFAQVQLLFKEGEMDCFRLSLGDFIEFDIKEGPLLFYIKNSV